MSLYRLPETDYDVIGQARRGTRLERLDESRGWFKVELPDGTEGWIYGQLVSGNSPQE